MAIAKRAPTKQTWSKIHLFGLYHIIAHNFVTVNDCEVRATVYFTNVGILTRYSGRVFVPTVSLSLAHGRIFRSVPDVLSIPHIEVIMNDCEEG